MGKEIEALQEKLDKRKDRKDVYSKLYGSKPALVPSFPKEEKEGIESMPVELPEGLSEEDFMMAVMGAMAADERMNVPLSTSSNDGVFYRFNLIYMTDNMTGKLDAGETARMRGFEKVMLDGRKKAIEAVELYKSGDKSKLTEYQQSFLNAAKTLVETAEPKENIVYSNQDYVYELAGELIDREEFKEKNQDAASLNLRNVYKIQKLEADNIVRKQQLLENIPPEGSKEREDKLVDIVLTAYIAGYSQEYKNKETEKQGKILTDEFVKLGHKKGDLFVESKVKPYGKYLADLKRANEVTANDLMLYGENGFEQLKELYGESIKKSVVFQMLLMADKDSLGNLLGMVEDTIHATHDSLDNFKDAKIPQELQEKAAKMSEPYEAELQKMRQTKVESLKEPSKEFLRHKKYESEEVRVSEDEGAVKSKLGRIDNLLGRLKDADPAWRRAFAGNQDKFAAVKESLTKLNTFAKTMNTEPGSEDYNEYIRLSKETEKAAQEYMEYKKTNHSDSEYEKKRIATVEAVHDALMYKRRSIADWNVSKTENVAEKKKAETNLQASIIEYGHQKVTQSKEDLSKYAQLNQKLRSNSLFSGEVKKVYYGGDYEKINGDNYSTKRGAVISIAAMALAATGKYSLNDLANPTKLTEEKRKMGEEVVGHIEGHTHDDQKWIAKNIIEGQKKMVGMVEEFCDSHDVLAENFEMHEDFGQFLFSQDALFDSYQELAHCLKEGDEYLKEAYPDDPVQSANQFREDIQDKVRPLTELARKTDKILMNVGRYANNGEFKAEIVQNAIEVKCVREALLEKRQQNPDQKITRMLNPQEVEQTLLKAVIAFGNGPKEIASAMANEVKTKEGVRLSDIYIDKIVDGSMFKDMQMNEMGTEVKNVPTVSQLKAAYSHNMYREKSEIFDGIKNNLRYQSYSYKDKIKDNKAAEKLCEKYVNTAYDMEKRIVFNMTGKEGVETCRETAKQFFKEKMALDLCSKFPSNFEKCKNEEEILKGVEQFKGYKELSKRIDTMALPEIIDLWDSNITSEIIQETMAQLDLKNKETQKNLGKENVAEKNTVKNTAKNEEPFVVS